MIVILVGTIGVFRSLQSSAFRSIQLASTLAAVTQRGRQVVDGVYPDQTLESATGTAHLEVVEGEVLGPAQRQHCRPSTFRPWFRCAERTDVVIELCGRPGEVIPERGRVALVHGVGEDAAAELLPALRTGIMRTFDQDPAMALRVLADIALRALSPAVNDPTTAIEALNGIDQLLRLLADRELAVETVKGSDGELRVLLRLPSWHDYVSRRHGRSHRDGRRLVSSPMAHQRLLTELVASVPAGRAEALRARLGRAGEGRA